MLLRFLLSAILCGVLTYPAPAMALSCAWPTMEQAKQRYPITVLGKVEDSRFVAAEEKSLLSHGKQYVTLHVSKLRAPEEVKLQDGRLVFQEIITAYDGSFFKKGEQYLVFLEPRAGQFIYPVCGFHLRMDVDAPYRQDALEEMGWKP